MFDIYIIVAILLFFFRDKEGDTFEQRAAFSLLWPVFVLKQGWEMLKK